MKRNASNLRQSIGIYFSGLMLAFACFSTANAQSLLPKLQDLFGKENVKYAEKSAFEEYYSIVIIVFKNIPAGIDPKDNEKGTEQSLEKLARYVGSN